MPYPLSGARVKVARAQDQLNMIEKEISAFLDTKPYRITHHIDKAGEGSFVINFTKRPPLIWSVMIGEYIHNLRSALDHMIFEIANAHDPSGVAPDKTE